MQCHYAQRCINGSATSEAWHSPHAAGHVAACPLFPVRHVCAGGWPVRRPPAGQADAVALAADSLALALEPLRLRVAACVQPAEGRKNRYG